jgi:hypothetical protein
MSFTPEELEQLGAVIDAKVASATSAQADAAAAEAAKPVTNDEAQNQPENQPDYWVHLADGSVFRTKDSQSSHMLSPTSGISEVVAARFPAGVE